MSKRTSGPWEARPSVVLNDDIVYWSVFANGSFINPFGTKADASLMAAAPDLLEALEEVMKYGMNTYPEVVKQARAAIAKARGEE